MAGLAKKFKDPWFINLGILFLVAAYVGHTLLPSIIFILEFVLKILAPFVIALIFYYLFRPMVQKLQTKMSVYLAIFIAYVVLAAFFAIGTMFVYPVIYEQISLMKSADVDIVKFFQEKVSFFEVELPAEFKTSLVKTYSDINTYLINSVINFFTTLTGFLIAVFISFFILFYFLKDDKKIYSKFIDMIPDKHLDYVKKLLRASDGVLIHFIHARVVIAFIAGFFLLGVFLLMGIKYPFLLAFTSMVLYVIPTVGNFAAMILPLIVGFSTSTIMGVEALIVMTVTSIFEGFLVTPQVMEQELYIHPLTLILLLLVSGAIYGIFGVLFATPAYVLIKVFFIHTYNYFKQQSKETG